MSNAKSIIDIEVNSGAFTEFAELFKQYKATLGELPGQWAAVNKTVEDGVSVYAEMTAALLAQAELFHRREESQQRVTDAATKEAKARTEQQKREAVAQKKYEDSVARVGKTIKDTRANVTGIVSGLISGGEAVLKWVGIGGIASGLVGAGGLFGLDRLAGAAGESRRSAQGLDTTSGNEKAFALNYERLVDPGSYLSNIENVARTPGLQYGVGADIARMSAEGKDTAQIGADLIPLIKQSFKQYGENAYGLKASGLDNVVSLQDAIRISHNSDVDIAGFHQGFEKDRSSLDTKDQTLKSWQDLDKQLGYAGEKIEQVLINDLSSLAPVINHLSGEAVDLVDKWTKELVPAIDHFASYFDSDEFKSDLKSAADDVRAFAHAAQEAAYTLGLITRPDADPGATTVLGDTARAFGGGPRPDPKVDSNHTRLIWNATHPTEPPVPLDPNHPDTDTTTPQQYAHGYDPNNPNASEPFRAWLPDSYLHHLPGTAPWEDKHNPGNLRVPGKNEFQHFDSDDDGIRAIDHQIKLYENRDHLDTISKIITKYAPANENDTATYIKNASDRTGFGADQHIDVNDPAVSAKLIAAITKQENAKSNYTPPAVVTILNQTGGSAIVSTSQLAR